MLQFLTSLFLNVWLVVAVVLFIAILWHAFRPSSRTAMELHALIPFEREGGKR